MTNREFYEAIMNENVTEELKTFAQDAIVKLDKTNEARKAKTAEKTAEKMAERQPVINALVGALTDEYQTATSLIEAAGLDIKPQAVATYFRLYVDATAFEKGETKTVNASGKSVKAVGYRKAQ